MVLFWILVLLAVGLIVYFILSFGFESIGKIGNKICENIKKNIGENEKGDS